MSKENKNSPLLHILTPFIVLALCAGIAVAAAIKPADKLKVFFNLAFMDGLKSDPDGDSGLVIRENEIISDYSGKTSETGKVVRPKFGELYAVIKSDTLGTDVPVYWGSGKDLLELGACQNIGSAVVGAEGNSVISAHVDTFFADLTELKENDTLVIQTNYGQFTYTVSEKISFSVKKSKPIMPTEDNRLTLYTCKKGLVADPDIRVGVVCELTKSEFYTEAGGDPK